MPFILVLIYQLYRVTPVSATLIDNIFTNALEKNNNSGVFTYDVSDHLPIFLISSQLTFNNVDKGNFNKFRKENIQTVMALNEDLATSGMIISEKKMLTRHMKILSIN